MASAPTQDPREARAETLVCRDFAHVAPKLAAIALAVEEDLNIHGYDAWIYETSRCEELAELYFALHRSHAPSALFSWHGYGLAFDVISKARGWKVWPEWSEESDGWVGGDEAWYEAVSNSFKAAGLRWGGDWSVGKKDMPHFQWHIEGMHESPSDTARALIASGGPEAVWRVLGAE